MNNNYDHIDKYINNINLNKATKSVISDFAILWSQYEGLLFLDDRNEPSYSYNKVYKKLLEDRKSTINENLSNRMNMIYNSLLSAMNKIDISNDFRTIMSRFHVWPKEENELKKYYSKEGVIDCNDFVEKFMFVALIVGRVRNNMFHGIKDVTRLNLQKDLFSACNEYLWLILNATGIAKTF
jgi:hypothetical protein